jgi:cardiolipin synthase A/B
VRRRVEDARLAEFADYTSVRIIAAICILAVAAYLFLALFQPGLKYKIAAPPDGSPASLEFLRMIEALADAKLNPQTSIEVLANGENFYKAELEAIRAARNNINLEAYIFQRGKLTKDLVAALTERARAGVKVNLLLDGIGSFSTPKHYFKDLQQAGGHVEWYHPFRWNTWPRYNNRTHRELIIIDGRTAFVGGAGFADHWLYPKGERKRWRDTMFRVEGEAVSSLQSTFAGNWLEGSGEIIAGPGYFPFAKQTGSAMAMVVNSEPSVGGSTRARILFQTLLASAKQSIHITTPYFLPDKSMRDEMVRAVKERGVEITILCPGKHSDHYLTRRSSRRLYGDLLAVGAKIYEYKPAMIHAKILTVDGVWSVVGSTNLDNRSFGLNDEINVAILDRDLAARLEQDFQSDIGESEEVTYQRWQERSVVERAGEWLGWLIERQQ